MGLGKTRRWGAARPRGRPQEEESKTRGGQEAARVWPALLWGEKGTVKQPTSITALCEPEPGPTPTARVLTRQHKLEGGLWESS